MKFLQNFRFLDDSDDDDTEVWQEVMGWIGTVLCIFFFISPGQMIIQLIKKKITCKDINIFIFICNLLNCVIWTAYGIRQEKMQMYVCNGTGTFFSVLWTCFYWVFFAEFKPLQCIIYLVLYLDIGLEVFWIFYDMIHNVDVVKYIVLVINIVMYFMPGAKMIEVIKTKNRDLIPVYMSFLSLVACFCWLTYGLGIGDVSVIVPNALGMVFSVMQVAVWSWAKCKYPNGDPNAKKEQDAIAAKDNEVQNGEKNEDAERKKTSDSDGGALMVKVGAKQGPEQPNRETIELKDRVEVQN